MNGLPDRVQGAPVRDHHVQVIIVARLEFPFRRVRILGPARKDVIAAGSAGRNIAGEPDLYDQLGVGAAGLRRHIGNGIGRVLVVGQVEHLRRLVEGVEGTHRLARVEGDRLVILMAAHRTVVRGGVAPPAPVVFRPRRSVLRRLLGDHEGVGLLRCDVALRRRDGSRTADRRVVVVADLVPEAPDRVNRLHPFRFGQREGGGEIRVHLAGVIDLIIGVDGSRRVRRIRPAHEDEMAVFDRRGSRDREGVGGRRVDRVGGLRLPGPAVGIVDQDVVALQPLCVQGRLRRRCAVLQRLGEHSARAVMRAAAVRLGVPARKDPLAVRTDRNPALKREGVAAVRGLCLPGQRIGHPRHRRAASVLVIGQLVVVRSPPLRVEMRLLDGRLLVVLKLHVEDLAVAVTLAAAVRLGVPGVEVESVRAHRLLAGHDELVPSLCRIVEDLGRRIRHPRHRDGAGVFMVMELEDVAALDPDGVEMLFMRLVRAAGAVVTQDGDRLRNPPARVQLIGGRLLGRRLRPAEEGVLLPLGGRRQRPRRKGMACLRKSHRGARLGVCRALLLPAEEDVLPSVCVEDQRVGMRILFPLRV